MNLDKEMWYFLRPVPRCSNDWDISQMTYIHVIDAERQVRLSGTDASKYSYETLESANDKSGP